MSSSKDPARDKSDDADRPPSLFLPRGEYGGDYDVALLEQYKLFVRSAERVSSRRIATHRYLLTVNAVLAALYGLQQWQSAGDYWALFIPVAGTAVAVLWLRIIASHCNLNATKFDIIHKMESRLPAAPFRHEWDPANQKKPYIEVTKIERAIPWMFITMHAAFVLVSLLRWTDTIS